MTTEQIVRDQLDRATQDVVGGPDLEAAVRQGRSRRLRRRGLAGLAAVAVLGVGAAGINALVGDDSPTVVRDAPFAAGPAPADDFVPGTDIDETLATTIAEHLPALPEPDDVYPSDGHTAGPISDADFAQAEDWQATYTLDGQQVWLISSSAAEPFSCQKCDHTQVPGGTLYHQTYKSGGLTWHGTWVARPDGTSSGLLESTHGGPAALDPAGVSALLQDARIAFSGA
jgi:hypothetical protein